MISTGRERHTLLYGFAKHGQRNTHYSVAVINTDRERHTLLYGFAKHGQRDTHYSLAVINTGGETHTLFCGFDKHGQRDTHITCSRHCRPWPHGAVVGPESRLAGHLK